LSPIYKLLDAPTWRAAQAAGVFTGSTVDVRDGFIHFSGADQVQETARLHFKDQADLVLLTIDAEPLGSALKWEPSRGGALFPHLFAPLPVSAVLRARPIALGADGAPWIGPLD
jgi:uncharacterized protein (DUF952 family)